MFNHNKTTGYRVSLFYDSSRQSVEERIDDPYEREWKIWHRNAEATWRRWVECVLSNNGGSFCPDGYAAGDKSRLFDNRASALKAKETLEEDTTIYAYPYHIALPASLTRLLNAQVTLEKIEFPANIQSTWLTDREYLNYSPNISNKKLLEILRSPKSIVARWNHDRNNYGEFWFITVMHKDQCFLPNEKQFGPWCMQWYGMGEHENRGEYVYNWQHVSTGQWVWGAISPLDKEPIIARIERENNKSFKVSRKTKYQELFTILAELNGDDDDAAYIEMEDNDFGEWGE